MGAPRRLPHRRTTATPSASSSALVRDSAYEGLSFRLRRAVPRPGGGRDPGRGRRRTATSTPELLVAALPACPAFRGRRGRARGHRGARRPGHLRQRRGRRAATIGPSTPAAASRASTPPSSPRCRRRSATSCNRRGQLRSRPKPRTRRSGASFQDDAVAQARIDAEDRAGSRVGSTGTRSRLRWITRGLRVLDGHRRPRGGGTAAGAPPRLVRAVLPGARPHHARRSRWCHTAIEAAEAVPRTRKRSPHALQGARLGADGPRAARHRRRA